MHFQKNIINTNDVLFANLIKSLDESAELEKKFRKHAKVNVTLPFHHHQKKGHLLESYLLLGQHQ